MKFSFQYVDALLAAYTFQDVIFQVLPAEKFILGTIARKPFAFSHSLH